MSQTENNRRVLQRSEKCASDCGLAKREVRKRLRSREEWQQFASRCPEIFDRAYIRSLVDYGTATGINSSFLGHIPPELIDASSTSHRERFFAAGLNSRQRALLDMLADLPHEGNPHELRIYAHEAITPLALVLRGRYPRFLGSEYAANDYQREWLFPIPAIDITRSGFKDACFDVILSGDVFEHVPDLPAALTDSARILRPGGHLLATVPFLYDRPDQITMAVERAGAVEHLHEPIYHGNPVDPGGGSLVFQLPAWSLLDMARSAGFSHAEMVFWSSVSHGIVGEEISGVFVLDARR